MLVGRRRCASRSSWSRRSLVLLGADAPGDVALLDQLLLRSLHLALGEVVDRQAMHDLVGAAVGRLHKYRWKVVASGAFECTRTRPSH